MPRRRAAGPHPSSAVQCRQARRRRPAGCVAWFANLPLVARWRKKELPPRRREEREKALAGLLPFRALRAVAVDFQLRKRMRNSACSGEKWLKAYPNLLLRVAKLSVSPLASGLLRLLTTSSTRSSLLRLQSSALP